MGCPPPPKKKKTLLAPPSAQHNKGSTLSMTDYLWQECRWNQYCPLNTSRRKRTQSHSLPMSIYLLSAKCQTFCDCKHSLHLWFFVAETRSETMALKVLLECMKDKSFPRLHFGKKKQYSWRLHCFLKGSFNSFASLVSIQWARRTGRWCVGVRFMNILHQLLNKAKTTSLCYLFQTVSYVCQCADHMNHEFNPFPAF